ncbi:hypothetical protein JCM1841_002619 [Sporobolomyces salmonicolor]
MSSAQLEKRDSWSSHSRLDVPAPAPHAQTVNSAPALKKVAAAGVLFIVVFWICALHLFGMFYDNSQHAHRLKVLVVDFDGGSVGSALVSAVSAVNGQKTWPTFVIAPASATNPEAVEHKVWDGDYWGAIYATAGATSRFSSALLNSTEAISYDASQALMYAGLEQRYNTAWTGFVLNSITKILQSTTQIFGSQTVAPLLTTGATYGSNSAAVLANPIGSTFVNLVPFEFGSRIIFNTIGFVFPSLFQFFFIMALNNVFALTGAYRNMSLRRHVKYRLAIGNVWSLLTALSVIGWYLMFDESYNISARNFFALWAIAWLNSIITFDFFDILTTYVPPAFISYPTVMWIILSVSSVIYPLELSNPWYHIHYAVPSHAVWSVMITVFGAGAVNTLYYNLPILFAWVVVLKVGVFFSLRRKARLGAANVKE